MGKSSGKGKGRDVEKRHDRHNGSRKDSGQVQTGAHPGLCHNQPCGDAGQVCWFSTTDAVLALGLSVMPSPRPDDEDPRLGQWLDEYHNVWQNATCPCGKGYFCQEHGRWISGSRMPDDTYRANDRAGYSCCDLLGIHDPRDISPPPSMDQVPTRGHKGKQLSTSASARRAGYSARHDSSSSRTTGSALQDLPAFPDLSGVAMHNDLHHPYTTSQLSTTSSYAFEADDLSAATIAGQQHNVRSSEDADQENKEGYDPALQVECAESSSSTAFYHFAQGGESQDYADLSRHTYMSENDLDLVPNLDRPTFDDDASWARQPQKPHKGKNRR